MKTIFFWKKLSPRKRAYFQILLGAFLVILIPIVVATLKNPNTAKASWLALSAAEGYVAHPQAQRGNDNWAYC